VAIALRPESVTLLPTDDAGCLLRGSVSEVYFQGDHALAQVTVEGTAFLAAVREDVLPERGARVGLGWRESAMIPLISD
jgi:ABC-type Fe3+/spermidine/putrescine transport system ATPase subunit